MKAATGELNLTVITIIAVAAIVTFFWFMWNGNGNNSIQNTLEGQWEVIGGNQQDNTP